MFLSHGAQCFTTLNLWLTWNDLFSAIILYFILTTYLLFFKQYFKFTKLFKGNFTKKWLTKLNISIFNIKVWMVVKVILNAFYPDLQINCLWPQIF